MDTLYQIISFAHTLPKPSLQKWFTSSDLLTLLQVRNQLRRKKLQCCSAHLFFEDLYCVSRISHLQHLCRISEVYRKTFGDLLVQMAYELHRVVFFSVAGPAEPASWTALTMDPCPCKLALAGAPVVPRVGRLDHLCLRRSHLSNGSPHP